MNTHPETKKIFVATHGQCVSGFNPGMTEKGINQVANIGIWGIPRIIQPSTVLVETGKRFLQTYEVLQPVLNKAPMKRSSFCGDSNPWEFLEKLPNNTLLCSGKEFLTALGLEDFFGEGVLIEISVMIRKARHVMTQGDT